MFLSTKKKFIGIEIGLSSIKVVGLRKEQKRLIPEFYRIMTLAPDQEQDEAIGENLRLIAEDERVGGAEVYVTLPASLAVSRVMKLSTRIPPEEAEQVIKDEIAQMTFDDVDEMRIVASELEDVTCPDDYVRIFTSGINEETLDEKLNLLRAVGLEPQGVDLDSVALHNAFEYSLLQEEDISLPQCLVEVGANESRCLILAPGHAPFFRVIDVGSSQVTRSLMAAGNIDFAEADALKIAFFKEMQQRSETVRSNPELIEIFCNFASELIHEVRRCIRHYQSTEAVAEFGRVYLTGGGARVDLLTALFEHELAMETRFWDPYKEYASGKDEAVASTAADETLRLGPAIGTVLQGVIRG